MKPKMTVGLDETLSLSAAIVLASDSEQAETIIDRNSAERKRKYLPAGMDNLTFIGIDKEQL